MQQYNVLLTGGGFKGAYQYSFFKTLYAKKPDFLINKLFAISVGSLNALPIITKRIDYLDQFWLSNTQPSDLIFEKWPSLIETTKKKSLFMAINEQPIKSFISSLNPIEKYIIYKKLHVLAYDHYYKIPVVFKKMYDVDIITKSIQISCSFPSLIPPSHPTITDGAFISTNHILNIINANKTCPWIVLDISNLLYNLHQNDSNIHIFSPSICKYSIFNTFGCINQNKQFIEYLLEEGDLHASKFYTTLEAL